MDRLKNELKLEQAESARRNERNLKLIEEKNVEMETLKAQNNELKALLGILNIRYSFFKDLIFNFIYFYLFQTQKFSSV